MSALKRLHSLFPSRKELRNQTYYPELKQKTPFGVFWDNIKHYLKYHRLDTQYYYLYGFDIKNFRNQDEYLDYGKFMQRRDYLNNHPSAKEIYSYTGVLQDKFYFSIFMEKMGFAIPKTFGLFKGNTVYLMQEGKEIPIEDILDKNIEVICKPLNGIGGVGIFTLKINDGRIFCDNKETSLKDLKEKLSVGKFFSQSLIKNQHPLMEKLYPKAINTVRITTVRDLKTGNIELMGAMLLMGARDAIVSNWHYGGVIINIEPNGYLNKYGYSLYEKRISEHPDTGVKFESFKVPYFEECIAEAKRCHELFYGVHSIGWDFAILPDGILFIEGNDNWGMAAHQMVGGGLTEKFNKYFFK